MAERTRSQAHISQPTPEPENEFDMPDEFASNTNTNTNTNTPTSQQPSDVTGVLSDSDVDEIGFNDEQDEAERAKLNHPTGDWEKDDSWKSEKRVQAGNCMPGDLDSAGRTSFNVMGKPKPRQQAGLEYEPTLFLRLSPDRRYKEDKPTDVDMAYKLFLKAKDVYIALHSEKPATLRQLRVMLEEDNYVVRTMNGDNGPVVVDIKVKRERR